MARRKRQPVATGAGDDDVNLTPMLDVVFILLIFFIVTAQFIKEPGVEILREEVENKADVTPLAILVAIDENSDIYINKRLIEPNEVEFTIRELREDNPKGELVVQADSNSEARVLVDLMDAIVQADGRRPINVSTEQD